MFIFETTRNGFGEALSKWNVWRLTPTMWPVDLVCRLGCILEGLWSFGGGGNSTQWCFCRRRKTRCLHIPQVMSGRTAGLICHRKATLNSAFSLSESQNICRSRAAKIAASAAAPVSIRWIKSFTLGLQKQTGGLCKWSNNDCDFNFGAQHCPDLYSQVKKIVGEKGEKC